MGMKYLFIVLIIILIPGLIASLILSGFTRHKKWDNFTFTTYTVIFGFFSYFILIALKTAVFHATGFSYNLKIIDDLNNIDDLSKIKLENAVYCEIFAACIIGVAAALFMSYVINHKLISRLALRFNIADKNGVEGLFYAYLDTKNDAWLSVRDYSKNILYTGRLASYSEQDDVQEIALRDVDIYRSDLPEPYHAADIYLCGKYGDLTIEPLTAIGNAASMPASGEKPKGKPAGAFPPKSPESSDAPATPSGEGQPEQ